MQKLLIFIGTMIGGSLGWWAGEQLGFDLFVNFLLSGAGSLTGIYAGWKIARSLPGRM
jgi:hypothetical protein